MPVDFRPEAIDEVEEARDWYAARSAKKLAAFDATLSNVVRWIGANPGSYPEAAPGIRSAALSPLPYAVVYRELSGSVEVIAVAHARRRPGYWAGRA